MNAWLEIPNWIQHKLKQEGIDGPSHPRYINRTPKGKCECCGSAYHTIGWCPAICAWTPRADSWRKELRDKHRSKVRFQSQSPAAYCLEASRVDDDHHIHNEALYYATEAGCDPHSAEAWDTIDYDQCDPMAALQQIAVNWKVEAEPETDDGSDDPGDLPAP